jgi:hypothetical protein
MEIQISGDAVITAANRAMKHLVQCLVRQDARILEWHKKFKDSYLSSLKKDSSWFWGLFKTDKDYIQFIENLSPTEVYRKKVSFGFNLEELGSEYDNIRRYHCNSAEKVKLDINSKIEHLKKLIRAASHASEAGTMMKLGDADLELVSEFIENKNAPYR